MFFIDQPITKESDDRLNRCHFAVQVGKGIETWTADEGGLVVALYGPWGSGKTSVKNLVCNYLRKSDMDPQILEFNPWLFKNQEDLARQLLSLIGKRIALFDPEGTMQVQRNWNEWATTVTMLGQTGSALGSLLTLVGVPILGEVIKQLGAGSSKIGGALASAKDAIQATAEVHDIENLRLNLLTAMKNLKKPILVTIDDIDRLTNEEIRTLFQVIKTHCDFPNLGFLLLCQQENIEASLAAWMPPTSDGTKMGRLYLDKIVHVGLNLPPLRSENTVPFLLQTFKNSFSEKTLTLHESHLNETASKIAPTFETLRRVKRFGSILSFQAGVFTDNDQLTIAAADLVTIEWLRLIEPQLYYDLVANIHRLFSDSATGLRNELTNDLPERLKPIVTERFQYLFPWLGTSQYKNQLELGRLGHESTFKHYVDLIAPVRKQFEEHVAVHS
jgi:predicted KAP-like P-loop ATPase